MAFTMRTSVPANKLGFYMTKSAGGWSTCIQGSPTKVDANVLSNCVGYACGRFNEIIGSMKYPSLNCNAENFIERAQSLGLKISQTPSVGAIGVHQKGATLSGSDGAGHVWIVERINSDGSLYTSESGYGGSAFWNQTRKNTDGRWGAGSAYSFRGFIVNPSAPQPAPTPTPQPTPSGKFNIGDKVVITGDLYVSSNATSPSGNVSGKVTNITRKADGSAHPYNTTGDLGWMNESSIAVYVEPTPAPTPEPEPTPVPTAIVAGDIVAVDGRGNANSNGTSGSWTSNRSNQKMKVIIVREGAAYPYACNQYAKGTPGNAGDVTGWWAASGVRKV